jgi:DNA-binding MarR family transcriptional regulator
MESSTQLTATLQEFAAFFMRGSTRHLLLYAKESGLSMSQIGAMLHIHRKGVSGVSDIGDDLGVTHPAASQMLERLVLQGLVVRSEDPHDRRVKQIVLTEEGHRRLQESIQARQGWLDALANLLSPEEQDQVTAALRILLERANKLENDARQECDG